ncbi:MAG: DUF1361 domain-containing protein [Gloeobacteraceae cyanobacterium ES-bin-316]|nr:DUF1361 domain-containing protein [Ferruginibacter sp.]
MKTISSFNKLLCGFLLFIGLMIAFRIFYSGSLRFIFMSWNIFLAWIPFMLSGFFMQYRHKEKWKQVVLFITWLLFFPNALYIVTDLVHLQGESNMPWWYDAVLLFASSFIGIVMAFISLRKAEFYLKSIFNKAQVSVLVAGILFLGSFGVYLGRFQRWNSWDVVNNPLALGGDIFSKIINPVENYKVWAITVLFTAIYSLLYFFLKILPQAFSEIKNTGR